MDPTAIEIPNPDRAETQCVAFKLDGRHLVGGNTSGHLRQWKIDSGQEVGPAMKTRGEVFAAVVSMNGEWIVSGDAGHKITVWNAATNQAVLKILVHTARVYTVDVSSDSSRIVSGSEDQTARVFSFVSGSRVLPPLPHNDAVLGVKYSPDGSQIATATCQDTFVYDAHSGDKLFSVPIEVAWRSMTALAWSSYGEQLFVASPGKMFSIDISTSTHSEWPIQDDEENASIVTCGQFVACSAGSSVSFWDYTSRKQIGGTINHATDVNCISVSHDGRYLACGHDKGITIHNLSDIIPSAYLHVPRVSRVPLMELRNPVFESWMLGSLSDTERILSDEIEQGSKPGHYALAARSLVRSHSREWTAAIEDADRSLQIKESPIGQIAMSLALIGAGKQATALDNFDFVFLDSDPNNSMLLLVIKCILMFTCGEHRQAMSRLQRLVTSADDRVKGHYAQVLGSMYLKRGDYKNALQALELAEISSTLQDTNPLTAISLIFGWNFDSLKITTWQCLCEALYNSGRIKEVGETLLKMVGPMDVNEKEPAHGRILEHIVMRSGQVTLLAWTGKSSTCNSCLPNSPAVYCRDLFVPPSLARDELEKQADDLRVVIPLTDALVIYDRLTRLQPVRFAHFRLHLPCIVFDVVDLKQEQTNVYRAETTGLGEVEITTMDLLPLTEPRRLALVDTRIHHLDRLRGITTGNDRLVLDVGSISDSDSGSSADADIELVHVPIVEEVPHTQPDAYTRALRLITHLRQPFSALLLLRQSDGAYKRVAAEHEIIARWSGSKVANDIRVEVLEIL